MKRKKIEGAESSEKKRQRRKKREIKEDVSFSIIFLAIYFFFSVTITVLQACHF